MIILYNIYIHFFKEVACLSTADHRIVFFLFCKDHLIYFSAMFFLLKRMVFWRLPSFVMLDDPFFLLWKRPSIPLRQQLNSRIARLCTEAGKEAWSSDWEDRINDGNVTKDTVIIKHQSFHVSNTVSIWQYSIKYLSVSLSNSILTLSTFFQIDFFFMFVPKKTA